MKPRQRRIGSARNGASDNPHIPGLTKITTFFFLILSPFYSIENTFLCARMKSSVGNYYYFVVVVVVVLLSSGLWRIVNIKKKKKT